MVAPRGAQLRPAIVVQRSRAARGPPGASGRARSGSAARDHDDAPAIAGSRHAAGADAVTQHLVVAGDAHEARAGRRPSASAAFVNAS